jgi:hypothetical protein
MKTAVEWLYVNLQSHFEHDGDLLEVVQFSFEQAKEMEREQIMDAYNNGDNRSAELYYNETFKSNEQE